MLEMMLSGGGDPNLVSWSGPGNKKLIAGNKEAGYFGTVTPGELFSMGEISAMVTSATKLTYALSLWHKFILNNSTVFYIPSSYVLGRVTWKDLYNSGLIYGKKGYGRSPLPSGMKEVEQFNLQVKPEFTKGKMTYWPLVVRTPYGTDTDPYADMSILSAELALFDKVVHGPWANNGVASSFSLMLERSSNATVAYRRNLSTLNAPMGGYGMEVIGSEGMGSSAPANYAWTPVVELVRDPNIVLGPYAVTTAAEGVLINTPVPSFGPVGVPVKNVTNVAITTGKSIKPPGVVVENAEPIIVGQAVGAAQTLVVSITTDQLIKAVGNITADSTAQAKPYLSASNAPVVLTANTPDLDPRISLSFEKTGLISPVFNIKIDTTQQSIPLIAITTVTD